MSEPTIGPLFDSNRAGVQPDVTAVGATSDPRPRPLFDSALDAARRAVMIEDDGECIRRFDALVARYGHDEASRAWRTACQEADRDVE